MLSLFYFFFFNDTATTEIYTLSLHDALPISTRRLAEISVPPPEISTKRGSASPRLNPALGRNLSLSAGDFGQAGSVRMRSEEHTSELQSRQYLVCRLLLEKKKHKNKILKYCT